MNASAFLFERLVEWGNVSINGLIGYINVERGMKISLSGGLATMGLA